MMKRRDFMKMAGVFLGASQSFSPLARAARKGAGKARGRRVAILGGGVAGMSAAHELMERGFEVTVYEAGSIPGGKARSMSMPGTGTEGRRDLPGEHGFRFFPGFYKHVTDTMKRIPVSPGRNAYDNLVNATQTMLASTAQGGGIRVPVRAPFSSPEMIGLFLKNVVGNAGHIPARDLESFTNKLLVLLTSCEERRFAEYENIPWWKFVEADRMSETGRKYLAVGFTRNLVACKAEEISTRTCGVIFLQLLLNAMGQGENTDRLLNGPTNEVWIGPWLEHLLAGGVDYRFEARVEELLVAGGEVQGAVISQGGRLFLAEADHFLCAVPVEVMQGLLTRDLTEADPGLARISKLRTEWMNGIQFYLARDVKVCPGHSTYLDSPWAVTSISQPQFWAQSDIAETYGDGTVRGILSCDISDWHSPGVLYGKPATECSAEEIKNEVWAQVRMHLKAVAEAGGGAGLDADLRDEDCVAWHLDPAIRFDGGRDRAPARNVEPLLVNTVGSWWDRPEAGSAIGNLTLASDYVRTHTDLACMEGANEAARRAVNVILERSGASEKPCPIWALEEPSVFDPGKKLDLERFRHGWPHI